MLAGSLKEKLRRGEKAVGLLMTFDFWPGYLEICRKQGVDFLVLDMEHGFPDPHRGEELCRTARLLDLPLLIRPASCAMGPVKRALDIGSAGLMVPWVETKQQLDTLHAAAFCPPRGRHGMGGPAIMAVDGTTSADWQRVEGNQFIMCQIETPRGLEFAPEAAKVEWLDALMLGPYDLAHNMGLVDEFMQSPAHLEAIQSVCHAAHAGGRWAGMVTGTGEDARRWFDAGFDLVIVGALITQFVQGLQRNLAAARPT